MALAQQGGRLYGLGLYRRTWHRHARGAAALLVVAVAGAYLRPLHRAREALLKPGPWLVALPLAFAAWEILTAKTAVLPTPFFAPPQALIEVYIDDWRRLGDSVLNTLKLLGFGEAATAAVWSGETAETADDRSDEGLEHRHETHQRIDRATLRHPQEGGDARQHAVRETRDRILFMDQQRDACQPGGNATGSGREPACTQHGTRVYTTYDRTRLMHGSQQPEWRAEPGQQALAAKTTDGNGLERKAVRRDEACLHAGFAPQPHHRHTPTAQHIGHGQRRKHVATRAASHDHDRTSGHRAPPGTRVSVALPLQQAS